MAVAKPTLTQVNLRWPEPARDANRSTLIAANLWPRRLRDPRAPASLQEANYGSVYPVHALIIEDEFLTAELIEDRLRTLGFTSFAFAMDEEEAVSAARERCPDLITSDVQLALGCGIDAVQRICDEKPIPILYITGTAMVVRERCPWAIVVQKPFGMADLREAVREARKAA